MKVRMLALLRVSACIRPCLFAESARLHAGRCSGCTLTPCSVADPECADPERAYAGAAACEHSHGTAVRVPTSPPPPRVASPAGRPPHARMAALCSARARIRVLRGARVRMRATSRSPSIATALAHSVNARIRAARSGTARTLRDCAVHAFVLRVAVVPDPCIPRGLHYAWLALRVACSVNGCTRPSHAAIIRIALVIVPIQM